MPTGLFEESVTKLLAFPANLYKNYVPETAFCIFQLLNQNVPVML